MKLWSNKWVKFSVVSIIYLLWFVLWSGYVWALLGLIVIYDIYISKLYMRLFWGKHLNLKENNSYYRSLAGWVEAIIFAVVVASLIRTYFVEMYVIPTSSMEKTLLIGDYLGVSKVSYGPKMPNTPLSIPFVHNTSPFNPNKKSYSDLLLLPYKRLIGFGEIKRNDVVVFNYPEGDSVALVAPQSNYYQLVRNYGRDQIHKQSEIIYHPVDKRDNYIKRAVAIAGDTLSVVNGKVVVNSVIESDIPNRQFMHIIRSIDGANPINKTAMRDLDIAPDDLFFDKNANGYITFLTTENVAKVKALANIESVEPYLLTEPELDVFPHDMELFPWSMDNFGPLWVPKKGATIALTTNNLPIYERVIKNYEGNTLEVKDNIIYINDAPSDSYTFKMDYFFMMGDNRHNSLDSRIWGFVPEDHIVGKASFTWFSVDKNKNFPSNIRFNRMFKGIK